jgi:hypothetical protein
LGTKAFPSHCRCPLWSIRATNLLSPAAFFPPGESALQNWVDYLANVRGGIHLLESQNHPEQQECSRASARAFGVL